MDSEETRLLMDEAEKRRKANPKVGLWTPITDANWCQK